MDDEAWPENFCLDQASPELRRAFSEELQHQHIDAAKSETLASVYLPLASWMHRRRQIKGKGHTWVAGINGAQGSGKSTLCAFLARILEVQYGLNVAVISIDDLYHGRSTREKLAREIHPLLVTRGVPGTHDIALGQQLFDQLSFERGAPGKVLLPVFDKARDDRLPVQQWRSCMAPVDIILFEGWCVGARAQTEEALGLPVNLLEKQEDPEGLWRHYVNQQLLEGYTPFFERMDCLVMLKVPDFEAVKRWRSLQEDKLRKKLAASGEKGTHLMNDAELDRFIMHYERLTRHQLSEMPERADMLLELDQDHAFCGIRRQTPIQK